MMPDVLLASPAEQVGLGQGDLCWVDACGCSSISWCDFLKPGMAA